MFIIRNDPFLNVLKTDLSEIIIKMKNFVTIKQTAALNFSTLQAIPTIHFLKEATTKFTFSSTTFFSTKTLEIPTCIRAYGHSIHFTSGQNLHFHKLPTRTLSLIYHIFFLPILRSAQGILLPQTDTHAHILSLFLSLCHIAASKNRLI